MATIKRKVFRVLAWTAIIAGLISTIFGVLLIFNFLRAFQSVPLLQYQIYLAPNQPKAFYYDGIAYEFNAMAFVQVQFPNGTVINNSADYILWPYELTIPLKSSNLTDILLGLYGNTFFLDLSMDIPFEAINWSRTNAEPLYIIGIFIVWFNLPLSGYNGIITPTTLLYVNPYIVP